MLSSCILILALSLLGACAQPIPSTPTLIPTSVPTANARQTEVRLLEVAFATLTASAPKPPSTATPVATADTLATEARLFANVYGTLTASAPTAVKSPTPMPTVDARATESQLVANVLATLTASAPKATPVPSTSVPAGVMTGATTATLTVKPTGAMATVATATDTVATPTTSATATPDPGASGSAARPDFSRDTCLACHTFSKLITDTANYAGWRRGQTASPHQYVPHNSNNAKDIPECMYCHIAHPLPLTSTTGLPKANGDWCYTCHHMEVLECGTCHE